MGPGNGTLMKDVLRATKSHPEFIRALKVCMVELSEDLRQTQQKALNVDTATLSENAKEGWVQGMTKGDTTSVAVTWYKFLQLIPFGTSSDAAKPDPVIFIGQEFLDAFPVHQFIRTKVPYYHLL
jgi:NADH dehydrogenase [ubiquinone] 1 alpha subcomplex assembly factor 7